ncbi:MAG: hypothetical protein FWG90_07105 [Oscillospiraceae bacterium]|nr:hypothetical protein [Oscillospiraceae bacterium]
MRFYKRIKIGQWESVGKFDDEIYAFEALGGRLNQAIFWQITKEEFDSYGTWNDHTEGEELYKVLVYKLYYDCTKTMADIFQREELIVKYDESGKAYLD